MKISNDINSNQNFKGIKFLSSVPAKLAEEIKTNSVIKQAGKIYSLQFSVHDIRGKEKIHCLMNKPKTDSIIDIFCTPPIMITRNSHWFDAEDLPKLQKTPDFFEKQLGPKKTFTILDRVTAFIESIRMSFLSYKDVKSGKAQELMAKYKNKYR